MITTQDRTKETYRRQTLDNVLGKRIVGTHNTAVRQALNNKSVNLKISNAEKLNSGTDTVANLEMGTTGQTVVYNAVQNLLNKYDTNTNALNDLKSYSAKKINKHNSLELLSMPDNPEATPTYVASDPSKPDDTSNTIIADTTNNATVNVLKLYGEMPRINPNEYDYKDKIRNRAINAVDVLPTIDDSLIMRGEKPGYGVMSPYRLITPDYLEQSDIVETTDYNVISPDPYQDQVADISGNVPQLKGDVPVTARVRYRYQYSFNGIIAAHKNIDKAGGFISGIIDVNNCDYIQIDAPVYQNTEYSILDGKNEIPILPIQQSSIQGEKLFYGLLPRFTIMNSDTFTVYKDNVAITLNGISDLNLLLAVNNTGAEAGQSSFVNNSTYTIDYIPNLSAQTYYPQNKTVRLKIVQRYLNDRIYPIETVTIRKYQNTSSWYLSSIDESGKYDESDIRVTRYIGGVS